jgi:hypothetical protein
MKAATSLGPMLDFPLQHSPYVRGELKGIVEALGKVGQADDEGQFHDLLFIIIFLQLFEDILPDCGCGPCHKLNKTESGFVLFIEGVTALVEEDLPELLVGYASLLRRSSVGAGSILTAIEHGRCEVRQLFVPICQRSAGHDGLEEWDEAQERFRLISHRAKDIGDGPELLRQGVVKTLDRSGGVFFGKGFDYRHNASSCL